MVPTQLTFRGAPHSRWWRFEEGDAYFDSPHDPEPNVLSMLLPEFFFIDINNWYLAPLLQTAGTIREITEPDRRGQLRRRDHDRAEHRER